MKRKLTIMLLLMMACPMMLSAQRVDFDYPGKENPDKHTEVGFTSWAVGRQTTASKTFDNGVTITLSAGGSASALGSNWSKQDVETNQLRLIGEEVLATNLDNGNLTVINDASTSLTLTITGLTPGEHTLRAYHNNSDKNQIQPDIEVTVNGAVVATGQKFSSSAQSVKEAGQSFVRFQASAGQPVVVTYTTKPVAGQSYTNTRMMLNGLEFDVAAIAATDPQPADQDFHAGTDGDNIAFSWKGADGIARHRLVLGTDPDQVASSTTYEYEGTATEYTKAGLYSMQTYYWRVDEVESDGTVHKGRVWSFKPRQLAFPEAEGYGRYANGGRGGSVYHVTSLSGGEEPGTLLYGLLHIEEPHYVVFDVSGIIELDFAAHFTKPNITIAGQTAPGKGVCIKASNIGLGSDVICRHMRFKRGLGVYGENTGNALGVGNDHVILDHTTAAWGTDETFSSRGAKNITFQYSMISEALGITGHKNYSDGTNHGYAATIGGSIGSFSHNLLVNCYGRNWSMGGGLDGAGHAAGELDMFNNVCYNWGGRTTDGGALHMQFVNNYYKMGPDTKRKELFIAQNEDFDHRSQFAYVSGNIRENKNHTLTADAKGETYSASGPEPELTWYYSPFFTSYATIHSAQDAFKIVTSYAGATMPMRDEHHQRNVKETVDGTYTYIGSKSNIKGEIDTEADITEHAAGNGWESYPEETRAADWDTDQDGMPDWWEQIIGSNASVANQNDDPDRDGWTLLEDYLDFMAHPYVVLPPNGETTIDLKPHFAGFFGQNGQSVTPSFSMEARLGSGLIAPTIEGTRLTVKATMTAVQSIGYVDVTVNDGETQWTQRFGVAVTAGTPTGIQTLKPTSTAAQPSPFYDLQGRRVGEPRKGGVYIRNGKKIIIQ
ncbi:MAG: hypothetical protein J6M01_01715 [Prevotella sp.]|nr:hypothetical protein [Prevotella sp.]